eukprot:598184-Hanusia_phi.AAC.4
MDVRADGEEIADGRWSDNLIIVFVSPQDEFNDGELPVMQRPIQRRNAGAVDVDLIDNSEAASLQKAPTDFRHATKHQQRR